MESKTTVAISQDLRKRLKKIGILLDISQSEVIERAIKLLERDILSNSTYDISSKTTEEPQTVQEILDEANRIVCSRDETHKKIQEKLRKSTISIDDIIIGNWNSGIDFE